MPRDRTVRRTHDLFYFYWFFLYSCLRSSICATLPSWILSVVVLSNFSSSLPLRQASSLRSRFARSRVSVGSFNALQFMDMQAMHTMLLPHMTIAMREVQSWWVSSPLMNALETTQGRNVTLQRVVHLRFWNVKSIFCCFLATFFTSRFAILSSSIHFSLLQSGPVVAFSRDFSHKTRRWWPCNTPHMT